MNSDRNNILNKNPLLSICIPSYSRIEILRNTLSSIYAQLNEVYEEDFEVIISDNDPKMSLKCLKEEFNYSNFHYFEINCQGFENSYYAMTYASGEFIKLHNNTMIWSPGSLKTFLQIIRHNLMEKPLMFFTNGIKLTYVTRQFKSFDKFMYDLSYFSSWSNGFCIWKEDFDMHKTITINKYFPQTSILLTQYYKESFISSDYPFFELQKVSKKGGYNIFKVFGIDYIDLLEAAYIKGHITKKSLKKIKLKILVNFFPLNIFKTKILKIEKYETDSLKQNLKIHYPWYAYYILLLLGFLFMPYYIYKYIKILYLKFINTYTSYFERQIFIYQK